MKSFCLLLFVTFLFPDPNVPVDRIDLKKYAGTWYSLYSIPTLFDKGSRETTTRYTLNKQGYYDVLTTYKKPKNEEIHSITSKIFPDEGEEQAKMKCQFIWPIKVDYWIIELADDYSYVVVGHPDHKFLFIMSRSPKMNKKTFDGIVERCQSKGYDVSKLTSQMHNK
ncbi:MAG TPA: lipocalin family protein [Pedobacter sp.]|nr:lipocalin family protein [Pedobacter sp.]